jgi:transcriptional regulator GlxA family with amidase domain
MSSRLDRILDWTELASNANYSPVTMAALAPVSLRQLERYFVEKFGKTPREWVRELQCQKARELIEQGYSNKATVAALRFTNEAEFCRIFKKIYGYPPQYFGPSYSNGMSLVRKNVV